MSTQQPRSPTGQNPDSSIPRKSLLERISSPFGNKTRTVFEFIVQADDPHRRYSPGDIVKGSVILKAAKSTRVTHIVVCLHGFVQVYKNPGSRAAEGFRTYNNSLGRGRGKRSGEYFGNGFATLFEDERVLCGDGRLDEGNYKFEFEMRFPDQTLPSSIDFERGTVSYLITATLTRPTSIMPVMYHDQKLTFAERIDVARSAPPQPRTISLVAVTPRRHPRSLRDRRKATQVDLISQDSASVGDRPAKNRMGRSTASVVSDDITSHRSPSPSTQSVRSRHSSELASATGSAARTSRLSEADSLRNTPTANGKAPARDITVTVKSLTGGTLRGDTVLLHISVSHTKQIRSLQGVIITLYRHARVDTHPALPIGPTTEGEKRKFEDYYPRSLTGLGGLSLSGAGSSHSFRKDLAQTVLPLMIDPTSLKAELHPKLRVPDDAFPTIACVPGAMISFRYYVEVILDIQGKLSSADGFFGSTDSILADEANGDGRTGVDGSSRQTGRMFAPAFVDTSAIRRDKGVVTCALEVVIGTLDSRRQKAKEQYEQLADASTLVSEATPTEMGPNVRRWDQQPTQNEEQQAWDPQQVQDWDPEQMQGWDPRQAQNWDPNHAYYQGQGAQWQGEGGYGEHGYGDNGYYGDYGNYGDYYGDYGYGQGGWGGGEEASYEFQPPALEEEPELSEKERIRRAEAMLLPSRPPGEEEEGMEHAEASSSMPAAGADGADGPRTAVTGGEGLQDVQRTCAAEGNPAEDGPAEAGDGREEYPSVVPNEADLFPPDQAYDEQATGEAHDLPRYSRRQAGS